MNENKEDKIWYSLGCAIQQRELRVRDDVRKYGLEAFVPLRYTVKTVRGQKRRALVPALSGLIFAKGTLEEVKDYLKEAHYPVYIKRSTFSNKEDYLTVPTKAMENFIAVTESHEEHVTYFRPEEISLQAGDRIRIKGGLYDGREGVIMRIKGKRNRQLVVQIPGFIAAAVEISPEMLEFTRKEERGRRKDLESRKEEGGRRKEDTFLREKPSKNIEKDKKLLMETAERLLFEIPDKYQQENEYYLLLSELRRARERLKTFKGFTPASEAELALPMYLAAVKLEEGVSEAEERLRKAVEKLKDSSKLKQKCKEYLERLAERPHTDCTDSF